MSEIKLCKDCKHRRFSLSRSKGKCAIVFLQIYEQFGGLSTPCSVARKDLKGLVTCGSAGKYWEKKPIKPTLLERVKGWLN